MSNENLESLKAELKNELDRGVFDFNKVAILSQNILSLDQESVRFSVDAKHIHRLGYELVGKQETALSELIKNAYDADANLLRIEFINYTRPGGRLIIKDDGHGMREEDIRGAWMRLSTRDKEDNPISPKFVRSRAGRKGIGRFAVERLGKRLILETEVKGQHTGIRVKFNWDEDFQHGVDLTQISSKIERYEKDPEKQGTTIIIEDLRDKWTETMFERVWKSVLLLQSPFVLASRPRAKDNEPTESEPDPGFKVYINGRSGDQIAEELSIERLLLENALAKITGEIDDSGQAHFQVDSDKLGYHERHDSDKRYLLLGKVKLDASYFIYRSGLISGISLRDAQQFGYKYGGIRIYVDGFRVLPYGEERDDWLKLAYDTGRRFLLVQANNNNFFGHIDLMSCENPLLEETSSREGLIENDAYDELRDFARTCLEWAALRIASMRGRKEHAGQKDFISKVRKPSEVLDEIIDTVKTEEINIDADITLPSLTLVAKLESIKPQIVEFEREVEKKEERHIQYEEMLRILASLGLSISVFSHEIKGALTRASITLTRAKDISHEQFSDETEKRKKLLLDELEQSIDRLFDLASYIVSLISHTLSRKRENLALDETINSFIDQFKMYLNKQGIKFDVDVDPPYLRTIPMHRSEIDSVLFNFLTNSVKAMERERTVNRKIKITARKINNYAVINFQDTGTGVPNEIANKIFDEFFTTSEYRGDDIAGPGTGLGLKIVKDIASANKGYVKLAEPEQEFNSNFEFAVPCAG